MFTFITEGSKDLWTFSSTAISPALHGDVIVSPSADGLLSQNIEISLLLSAYELPLYVRGPLLDVLLDFRLTQKKKYVRFSSISCSLIS